MGKYIDKAPPEKVEEVLDYLAYLKEQLNFIFDNYWKNIEGKVTFKSLEEPGETVIDGGNVVTGILKSKNGYFYVDLENGAAKLKDAEITGGTLDISTDYGDDDCISLRFEDAINTMRPYGNHIMYKDYPQTGKSVFGVDYGWGEIHDGDRVIQFAKSFLVLREIDCDFGDILEEVEISPYSVSLKADGARRAYLDTSGLTFYDVNGNVTAYYPAVQ